MLLIIKTIKKSQKITTQIGHIFDHPFRILIIFGSGTGKTNVVLSLVKRQPPYIDKICFFDKDPFKLKYQLEKVRLKKKRKVGIKYEKKSRGIY